jgi:hypothetical protein
MECYTPSLVYHAGNKNGAALEVKLQSPCYEGDTMNVTLHYVTNNETTAINWLTKD